MAFIPVPNTVMAELRYTLDGQRCENTLYFEYAVQPGVPDLDVLGGVLVQWWQDQLRPFITVAATLTEIQLTDLTTETAPSITYGIGLPLAGQSPGPTSPNNVSLAVSFRTAGRGRSSRGRNYLVGIPEEQLTANNVSGAYATSVGAAYDALRAFNIVNGRTWVVVSRFTDGAPRVTGVTEPVLFAIVVDTVVDSQRRRLPGRGA